MITTHARRRKQPRRDGGHLVGSVLRSTVLLILSLLFLLPFYLMVRNGLATDQEITSFHWMWWSRTLHAENIQALFNDPTVPFVTGLLNSASIAVLQVFGQLLFASLAGYGLARIPFRWTNQVFFAIVVTLMIPSAVTFVPTYLIVSSLGWVNTLQGIAVPTLFSAFATFLFRQFSLNFPRELEEAAEVDGLGYWGIYWHLLLPNSRPLLAALGSIIFIESWNAFLWPLVIGQDPSSWTIQIVLMTFLTAQTINLHEVFIGAAIGILPLVIVFLFLQRSIVEGVKQSGIKG